MPSAFKDSMTHRCCKSHYVSHFTAFFIVARAKRSIVKSFSYFNNEIRHDLKSNLHTLVCSISVEAVPLYISGAQLCVIDILDIVCVDFVESKFICLPWSI